MISLKLNSEFIQKLVRVGDSNSSQQVSLVP